MATWGFQTFADDGTTVTMDSRYVAGGVIAHVGVYAPGAIASLAFPVFAGRSAKIIPDWGWSDPASVVVDTALGYPRLTVTTSAGTRRFFLVVY